MSATQVENIDSNTQARRWCFTWNNYPTNYKDYLPNLKYSYIIAGEEIGKTGTPHIQGYVEFKSPKRLGTLVKAVNGVHWIKCRGSAEQNKNYCHKGEQSHEEFESLGVKGPNYGKNAIVYEDGDPGKQGNRSDLDAIKTEIDNGMSMLSIAQDNFGDYVRYHKGFEKYRYLVNAEAAKKIRDVNVEYWWGDTGTGKTYTAFTENPDAFMISEGVTGFWWTGYEGQKTIIMDEFRGNVPACQLLRILDIYPVQLSVHGGYVWCAATKIIITSNVDFEELYKNVDQRTKEALRRRIKNIRFFKKCDATEVTEGNSVLPSILCSPTSKLG